MRQTLSRGMVAAAAATSMLSLCGGGYALADSQAEGAAKEAPGVLSGDHVRTLVRVPANACGDSVDVVAALDPAFGDSCADRSATAAHRHRSAATPYGDDDSGYGGSDESDSGYGGADESHSGYGGADDSDSGYGGADESHSGYGDQVTGSHAPDEDCGGYGDTCGGGHSTPPGGGHSSPPGGGHSSPPGGGHSSPPGGGHSSPPGGGHSSPPGGGHS
ncbi:chaplin, partial [Streptomyces sp. NPDC058291]|uniref:chaplin n=1 Tax=Streptomyces sp. NPDC058291 TaxID=3346427 RepID=UPI0036E9E22F